MATRIKDLEERLIALEAVCAKHNLAAVYNSYRMLHRRTDSAERRLEVVADEIIQRLDALERATGKP